ncbi:MAG: hypothetical protein B7Y99_09810 [Caulobacterales bacterium 32-69-10]|nr:MAG: hypothetical protein B7Y99_09810 [Caulobacterales bacterium 32-69-10]
MSLMRRTALLALVLAVASCGPDPGAQERAARTKVFTDLSQPDMAVVVGPAVMQSNFAMVDWTRGSFRGGRTLLRRDGKDWTMILCGGKPLTERTVLEAAGVPEAAADGLVSKLLREEGRLDSSRRDQFDKWEGLGAPRGVTCPEPQEQ